MNSTRTRGAVVVALLAVGLAIGWHKGYLRSRINVAVPVPLTGPNATNGRAVRDAIQLAIDEANARGGVQGHRLSLLEFDEPDDKTGAAAMGAAISRRKDVMMVVGHYSENATIETDQSYHETGMPNLIAAVIDPDVTNEVERFPERFRLIPSTNYQMRQAARFVHTVLKKEHIYAITANRLLHKLHLSRFTDGLARFGAKPPRQTEILAEDRDFNGLASIIKANETDLVFFAGDSEQAAALLTALRAVGSDATFFLACKMPEQHFLDLAKGAAEGTITTTETLAPADLPAARDFLKGWQAAGFGEPADGFALGAYATMQVGLLALERSALTRASIVQALKKGRFETLIGTTNFDNHGQSLFHGVPLYQVRGGRWVVTHLTTGEGDEWKPYSGQ